MQAVAMRGTRIGSYRAERVAENANHVGHGIAHTQRIRRRQAARQWVGDRIGVLEAASVVQPEDTARQQVQM